VSAFIEVETELGLVRSFFAIKYPEAG